MYILQTQVKHCVLPASIVNAHKGIDLPSNLWNTKKQKTRTIKQIIIEIHPFRSLVGFITWQVFAIGIDDLVK